MITPTPKHQWITCQEALKKIHKWGADAQAIAAESNEEGLKRRGVKKEIKRGEMESCLTAFLEQQAIDRV